MLEKGFILPDGKYIQVLDGNKASLSDYPKGTIEVPLKPFGDFEWDGSSWKAGPINLQELNTRISFEIRSQRDSLLKQSDWTQLPDAPVDQSAWATYRQALRDVPQQSGFPDNVTWPEEPK